MNKYLLGYMIVHNYQVVQRLLSTDRFAFKVPAYDEENFPFCITYDWEKNINVVNTKEGTMKSLVKCNPLSAFCVTTHNDQFDLHFTSRKEEEPQKWFSYHSRMQIRSDLIAVMKRIGQVPSETLEDNIKLI